MFVKLTALKNPQPSKNQVFTSFVWTRLYFDSYCLTIQANYTFYYALDVMDGVF